MVWFFFPGKNGHQHDGGAGNFRADTPADCPYAFYDLGGCIHPRMWGLAGVVGPDVDDDQPGVESVELSIIQAPEDVLCSIPSEAEVQYAVGAEQFGPG